MIEEPDAVTRDVDYQHRVFFGGKPVPSISDPLEAPGYRNVAVMFGLGADDEATDKIVGVQVIPMLLGAVRDHPEWAALAWAAMAGEHGAELLRERLPQCLDDVAGAFRQYWRPAPSIADQLAALAESRRQRRTA